MTMNPVEGSHVTDTAQGKQDSPEGRALDSRVLFLGIGGTGKEIVSRLKARLVSLRPDDGTPKVGFLVIDVDPLPPKPPELKGILGPNELCVPAERHLPSHVQAEVRRHIERGGDLSWVGERIPPGEMTLEYNNFIKGTERYRQAGLLAYLWTEKDQGVTGALREAIVRITGGARESISLHVFIVCSICGGTGSGMLIDTAFLARSMGLDHTANACDVSAMIVLPGVFRKVVDEPTYADLQRNASAVLTELDYFMYPKAQRGARTCNPADVDWSLCSAAKEGGLQLDTTGAIFQSVFLIDNQRNNGGTLGGPDVVFPAVADMLAHLSGEVIGDRFLEALNNAKATLRRRLQTGSIGHDMPHYSSLGLARVILPVESMAIEAAEVLSRETITRLCRSAEEPPSEAVVSGIVSSLGLQREDLLRELGLDRDSFVGKVAKVIALQTLGRRTQRIDAISIRIDELVRQKTPPDVLRRQSVEVMTKARGVLIAGQDDAQRAIQLRLAAGAQNLEDVVARQLEASGRTTGCLDWLAAVLARVVEDVERQLRDARKESGRDRSDLATAAEQEARKAEDRLAACPPGAVRKASAEAARRYDAWLDQRLSLAAAQAVDRIMDDGLGRLRRVAESAKSLKAFVAESLPREVEKAVVHLLRKEKADAPVTDIRVTAPGRGIYESPRSVAVRERVATDCGERVVPVLTDGLVQLKCSGDLKSFTLGPSSQPFEAACDWVQFLASCLRPFFASQRLDEYIPSLDSAGRYVSACIKEAEAFIKYNPTPQRSEAGDPITISVVAAPADSRLLAAFNQGQGETMTVCPQAKDPTTAIVFKAEIGILAKVLQFRKDAMALEAGMVVMPGLWTMGQVSHDIFWRDQERWDGLRLFFLSVAAARIRREPAPLAVREGGGARYDYYLDLGDGQDRHLGRGLQDAILRFLNLNQAVHRQKLWDILNRSDVRPTLRAQWTEVSAAYREISQRPDEVPSGPLRNILELRLVAIDRDPEYAKSA
jgi:hypothetical protein